MKKYLLLGLTAVFLLAGCAQSPEPVSDMATEESSVTEQGSDSDLSVENTLQIEVNGEILTATLENNSSADALIALLGEDSLMLDMEDYSAFEKVGELPETLPENNEELDTDAGDLILYQGNHFVIYYDKNSWSLTKLGHIDNISKEELQSLLGDGDVTATLSVRE